MPSVWFHIGMPKTASTAIQYYLCSNLTSMERRDWVREDIREGLRDSEPLWRRLTSDWSNIPRSTVYGSSAFRHGDHYLVTSEDQCHHRIDGLAGSEVTGLVFVREPERWVPSARTQQIFFSLLHKPHLRNAAFLSSDPLDTEAQMIEFTENRLAGYRSIISNIRSWADNAKWFDVVPYLPTTDVAGAVHLSLARYGISVRPTTPLARLRSSFPPELAMLALTIVRIAETEFACDRAQALTLGQLALGVEPSLLSGHLVEASTAGHTRLNDAYAQASIDCRALLADHAASPPLPPTPAPSYCVLERNFAVTLARTIIRSSLRMARLPENFDGGAYLAMNADLAAHGATLLDPKPFAIDHFARHGAFENRPVPVTDSPT